MLSEIKAVLLVPHEGDPHKLLAEGPCGARPPTAWLDHDGKGNSWWRAGCKVAGIEEHDALVLAWCGEPVEVGCFYAAQGSRFLCTTSVRNIVQFALHGTYHGDRPILEERGTLILLDAEGREVNND
jgi:hypothetical protein